MILTPENYHSVEAKKKYMSVSRYKTWVGCKGIMPCEARALAMERGEWIEKSTHAMLVSSYVDAHFSSTLAVFKSQHHSEICVNGGALRSDFQHMETVIARIERDPLMMMAMSGQKQVIMTGELFGVEWSIMIDSFDPERFVTDLKVMANFRKLMYVKDTGKMDFMRFYGYDLQLAIYQKIVELNIKKRLPCLIAVASKEKPEPDIAMIGFSQSELDDAMSLCEFGMSRIKEVRSGEAEPDSCGVCGYCKHHKVLERVIHINELRFDV